MKKIITGLLSLSMVLALLVGCSSSKKQDPTETTVCSLTNPLTMNVEMSGKDDVMETFTINIDSSLVEIMKLAGANYTEAQLKVELDKLTDAQKAQFNDQVEEQIKKQYAQYKGVTVTAKIDDLKLKATVKVNLKKADAATLKAMNIKQGKNDKLSIKTSVDNLEKQLGAKCSKQK